nr:MAG TPA: hypothetical protein [Caudoviricetes sp.]
MDLGGLGRVGRPGVRSPPSYGLRSDRPLRSE